VSAQPREQGAQHARTRLGIGERAVGEIDLDAECVGEHSEPALGLQRQHRTRQGGGADHRRVRPVQADAITRLA
jgi:hypothetical protein